MLALLNIANMQSNSAVIDEVPETIGMGVRITRDQRQALEEIASRQCNSVGGIIRLAITQLLQNEDAAKAAISEVRP